MKKKWIAFALCAVTVISLCACKQDTLDVETQPATAAATGPVTETTTEPPTETTTESTTQQLTFTMHCSSSLKGIIGIGETGFMKLTFNKAGYENTPVVWESSAPNILSVDASGKIEAKGIGKATITGTATAGDETATESYTYSVEKLVTGADFSTTSIEIKAGFSSEIGAKPLPEDATDQSITWGNSNPSVAAIEKDNRVWGYKAGNCVLTAYNNRGEALGTVNVKVLPGPVYGATAEFGNQIVEYSTNYAISKTNRVQNLRVAAQSIMAYDDKNGVLGPNERFSFNVWVGERTREKGYLDAGVFNGSKEETGLAGGICQVSTTLFNAALLANFEINARSPHSMDPQYGTPGRDAAIQWPNTDLQFTNTLDVPVKIVYQFSEINGQGVMTVRLFTPGETPYVLPQVRIEQGGRGLDYWMKRYVNGEVNYACNTHYVAQHP